MASSNSEGRRIRVLMIVENCPYLRDPRVRREAKTLTAAGYRVVVIAPNGDNKFRGDETADDVKVYRFAKLASSSTVIGHIFEYFCAFVAIAALSAYVLICEGFDIIHVANPPDGLIFIAAAYKILGKSVIYDQHDVCPELYGAKFGDWDDFIAKILFCLERFSYRLADAVIVTNESYKRLAMKRSRLPESQVTIVRNGPDWENAKNGKVDPQIRRRAPNILAFGGIIEVQDGVEDLIRALHALRYQLGRNDFICIVMGSGHSLEGAKRLTHTLGLSDNVHFTGWIPDRELYWTYLATADICVSPEPYNAYNNHSTFVKVMEYMAAGKPIVAFDLCETRFTAERSALYASCNDELQFAVAIKRLMDNAELRSTMGQAGQQLVRQRLAWQYSVPNLLKVYEDLAARYGPSRIGLSASEIETKANNCLRLLDTPPERLVAEPVPQPRGTSRE
jgi:glycosyltransferase involved in cell wall biosynthesis